VLYTKNPSKGKLNFYDGFIAEKMNNRGRQEPNVKEAALLSSSSSESELVIFSTRRV
jgi:hypothetical protein